MSRFLDGWMKLRSEVWRSARSGEVDEELALHVELLRKRYEAEGLAPDAARRKALRRFGDPGAVARKVRRIDRGRHRSRRRLELGGALKLDVRYAVRQLVKDSGFTAAAVLTLALGIGATVAVFSLLNAVVLRPLPYPDSDRLVAVWPTKNFNQSMVDVFDVEASSLGSVAGMSRWALTLVGEGDPEVVQAGVVRTNFFDVLGVRPLLGCGFLPEEEDPALSDVVVLTHGFWQRRFGGDVSVLGRTLQLEGSGHATRRVIGVLGPQFRPLGDAVDVYAPLSKAAGKTVASDSSWYVNDVVARLAPGATLERAAAEVRTVAQRIRERYPAAADDEEVARATVVPYVDVLVGDSRGTLWILIGAVALVLLIACANVANLLLARSSGRVAEVAVRKAIGATGSRIVRQSLVESLVLAGVGGVAGLALAYGLVVWLRPAVAERLPRATEVGLDTTVLVFAVAATVVAAVLSGLLPALRSSARPVQDGLRGGAPSIAGRRRNVLNRGLVAAELALAVTLVTGATLMVASFSRLVGTDPGFDAHGVLAMRTAPPDQRYSARDAQWALNEAIQARLQAVPGAERVGSVHLLPMSWGNWSFPFLAEGHAPPENAPLPSANFRVVTPGYFEVMRIPLLRGRRFGRTDDGSAPDVGIINEAMARELWPGEDAVGKEIRLFGSSPFTVVGVVADVHQFALDREPFPEMYVPLAQFPVASTVYVVRGRGNNVARLAPALRQAVWGVDQDIPIPMLRPLDEVVGESAAVERLIAVLLGAFAALALLLGAIGVYGVMTFVVQGRRREFAIRTAVGATDGSITREALRSTLPPLLAGLALGIAGAAAGGRLLRSLLYDATGADPVTVGGVVVLLAAVALAASWLPARQAGRQEPVAVLRE